jgi:hypothetical protein
MNEQAIFKFSGADAIAGLWVWAVLIATLSLPIPIYLFKWGGWEIFAVIGLISGLVLSGLRCSVIVTASAVKITKRWFFIPYRTYTAPEIEGVWFGGDWGEPHGAEGVVIKLGQREIHVGSRKSMHRLYAGLSLLETRRQWKRAAQPGASSDGLPQPPLS